MTTKYAARPTTYKGVEMRSRTEARFAAALDALGMEWQYEPRCFADGRHQYLPDFVVDAEDPAPLFIEVKGVAPDDLSALFERMRVIRASIPDARLALAIADQPFLWGFHSNLLTVFEGYDIAGQRVHSGPFDVPVEIFVPFGAYRDGAAHHFERLYAESLEFDWTGPELTLIPIPWGSYR